MKKTIIIFTLISCLISCNLVLSQSVSGTLKLAKNDTIRLKGFDGFKNYLIAETIADENGTFSLNYSSNDTGMGFLIASDNKPYFVVLNDEEVDIQGNALSDIESIIIMKGKENQWFEQYAIEHPKREQALSAWDYLEKMYKQDGLFSVQKEANQSIVKEKKRIKEEDKSFLEKLPKDSYVSWYLPMRSLVSSVSTIAQYRPEEIPATIEAFRKIDYDDDRLYKSGLYRDVMDNQIWFLENSGKPLDSVFIEMNKSIDRMLKSLKKNDEKLSEASSHLFDLLEQRSLFKAAEHLSNSVLNDDECGCSIQAKVADKLEQYRAMKKGNIASDFTFPKDVVFRSNTGKIPNKLSEVESDYTLIVFGASWCHGCQEEIPQILPLYSKWKEKGLEVVYVSLDTEPEAFQRFSSVFSFISICDYQKWDSPIARAYYIHATPTMYLLDKNREIVLKPNSVKQLDAWVDWYLAKE